MSITGFEYDINGNKTKIINPKAYEFLNSDVSNRNKYKISLTYDALNRLQKKIWKYNNSDVYTQNYYDAVGNKIKEKDEKDRFTEFTYDGIGRILTVKDPLGKIMTTTYDLAGNKLTITNTNGDTITYTYDKLNRVDTVKDAYDIVISKKLYDENGNVLKEIDAKGYISGNDNNTRYGTLYEYNLANLVVKVTDPEMAEKGITTLKFDYNQFGEKIKQTDALGNFIQYEYNKTGNLTKVIDECGSATQYDYDKLGNKISMTDGRGKITTFNYNSFGVIVSMIDMENFTISNKYDLQLNKVSMTDKIGNETLYTYDNRGLMLSKKVLTAEINYVFDEVGNRTSMIDISGVSTYEFDANNRLLSIAKDGNIEIQYTYDEVGNILTVTDKTGFVITNTYDKSNRLKTVKFNSKPNLMGVDGDCESILGWTTDVGRNLSLESTIKMFGNSSFKIPMTGYQASPCGITSTAKYPIVAGKYYFYSMDFTSDNSLTPNARLYVGNKGSGYFAFNGRNGTWGRNGFKFLADTTTNQQIEIDFYNPTPENTGYTSYIDGLQLIEITVDEYNNLSSNQLITKYPYNNNSATYNYDSNGNRRSTVYGGGVKEEYTYDKNNKLLTLVNKKVDNTVISNYSYSYDNVGRQIMKTDSYGTTNYIYDNAGRVLEVATPGKSSSYTYDGIGNRLSLNETYNSDQFSGYMDDNNADIKFIKKTSEYTYSDNNKLVKLEEKMLDSLNNEVLTKTVNYQYDNNGNQYSEYSNILKLESSSNVESINATVIFDGNTATNSEITYNEFDGFNRLVEVQSIKNEVKTIAEYLYNGDDLRVRKIVKKSSDGFISEVTNFMYDRQFVVLETDNNDAVLTRYVRGINYIGRLDGTGKLSYYLYNGHGDVTATVSEAGVVENQYDYDVFGTGTLTIEGYGNAIRYAGEYFDVETGLIYLRARYYNSYTGRFISEDSYWGEDENPLSLNRYTYTHNDPVNFVDPTGHNAQAYIGANGKLTYYTEEGIPMGVFDGKQQISVVYEKDCGLSQETKNIINGNAEGFNNGCFSLKAFESSVKKSATKGTKIEEGKVDVINPEVSKPNQNSNSNTNKQTGGNGGGSKSTEVTKIPEPPTLPEVNTQIEASLSGIGLDPKATVSGEGDRNYVSLLDQLKKNEIKWSDLIKEGVIEYLDSGMLNITEK